MEQRTPKSQSGKVAARSTNYRLLCKYCAAQQGVWHQEGDKEEVILKCEWCGMVNDADECGWRFAEPEDNVPRGTHILTCPSCGSSELFEVEEGEDEDK